jgi:hypothetical protein
VNSTVPPVVGVEPASREVPSFLKQRIALSQLRFAGTPSLREAPGCGYFYRVSAHLLKALLTAVGPLNYGPAFPDLQPTAPTDKISARSKHDPNAE